MVAASDIRLALISSVLLLTACVPRTILVPTVASLPPPPPRVYGEPLTVEELMALDPIVRGKLERGIKAHRDREEILETMVCATREPPCP